jgi:diacylglycerol O-acyltransferase-1
MGQDNKSQLLYWKSDNDVARKLPLGKIELKTTYTVEEGKKYVGPTILRPLNASYFWTWDLVDKDKQSLLRLSTDNEAEYKAWLAALAQAGCKPYADATADGSDTTASTDDVSSSLSPASSLDATDCANGDAAADGSSDTLSGGVTAKKLLLWWKKKDGSPTCTEEQASLLALRRVTPSGDRGFLVLGMVVLFVLFLTMVVGNFREFGIRYNPFALFLVPEHVTMGPCTIICWSAMAAAALLALLIERLAAVFLNLELKINAALNESSKSNNTSTATVEWLVLMLHCVSLMAMIGSVWYAVTLTAATNPLPGFVATFMMIVVGMKLISYIHINNSHRQARRSGKLVPGERGSGLEFNLEISGWSDSELPMYPENITMKNIAYFMVAPTLCYQLAYPWNPVMRPHMLMKRVAVLIFLAPPMVFITKQFIEPTIDSSMKHLHEMDVLAMLERVLKLGIPTLMIWLMMFYTVFHVWLNLLAEMTHFGDREFYSDWWNATTMGEYWRLWNMPVHKWMLRHVYYPCMNVGMGKMWAGAMSFFVSAVLHEVAVGMPLNMLRYWSFAAMMGQLPMIYLTERLRAKTGNKDIGNAIFWISFCILGQPLAMILYVYGYRMKSLGL